MAKITLYKDGNYGEPRTTITKSEKSLDDLGFNDKTSSVKVESGSWQIYTGGDYAGKSVTLSSKGGPDGDGNYPASKYMGGLNDKFSSIKLVNEKG